MKNKIRNQYDVRSQKLELIDLGPENYTLDEYNDCLRTLDRVGRWLGGDHGTFSAIKSLNSTPLSFLDVGCGGGTFTSRLAKQFPQSKVVGIDLNEQAITFAKKQTTSPNLSFEIRKQGQLEEPYKSYDVVVTTLVCHHLSDEHIIDFIKRAVNVAKKKVIINDLHRNPLAYHLFKSISPLFFRNRLVLHDGPLSVLRAFKKEDWVCYLEAAGVKPSKYTIKWQWAFRWIIEIDCEA